ncbi:MAG TPA: hypothetical protein VF928_09260 [Usitatibacteraceae bacterium]
MRSIESFHIFKAGKHPDTNGVERFFSEQDLRNSAAAYDIKKHEAPLVIGHPETNAPAYGWAGRLSYAEDGLHVAPTQLDEGFEDLYIKGRYKKISASFYEPTSKNNPVPGVWYLRHVGFLGAQPPAVKGLKQSDFADGGEGVVTFADWDGVTIAGLFRSIREWIISTSGIDKADQVIPSYQISSLEINAAADNSDGDLGTSYSEEQRMKTVEQREADVAAREAAIKTREDAVGPKEASFAERETKVAARETAIAAKEKQVLADVNVAFCESLVKAGKLLPKDKEGTMALLSGLSAEATVEFGEGDKKTKKSPLEIYKAQLEASEKKVEFRELGGSAGTGAGTVNFAAAAGVTVDADSLELHGKAQAYMAANKCDYETAVKSVQGS